MLKLCDSTSQNAKTEGRFHNPKVGGSIPPPATNSLNVESHSRPPPFGSLDRATPKVGFACLHAGASIKRRHQKNKTLAVVQVKGDAAFRRVVGGRTSSQTNEHRKQRGETWSRVMT